MKAHQKCIKCEGDTEVVAYRYEFTNLNEKQLVKLQREELAACQICGKLITNGDDIYFEYWRITDTMTVRHMECKKE